MQQARIFVPAAVYQSCANSVGNRSVPNLQGCAGAILGDCGQCECVTEAMGHFWRSRKRSQVRLRPIGCDFAVLFHHQSLFVEELQANVVSRD